jgi:dipeptidase E
MEGLTDPIDARLFSMLPARPIIGYLPSSPDPDRAWFRSREEYYAPHGARLNYYGLEEDFHPDHLDALFASDAIHLTGGNTFQFLYWLRRRGLLQRLRNYAEAGGVLVGVSAGAILMTPDITSSAVCGDEPYPGLDDYAGLGLVDFAVVPHHTGLEAAVRVFSMTFPGTVYGVPDGAGIVIENGRTELIGEIRAARNGVEQGKPYGKRLEGDPGRPEMA